MLVMLACPHPCSAEQREQLGAELGRLGRGERRGGLGPGECLNRVLADRPSAPDGGW